MTDFRTLLPITRRQTLAGFAASIAALNAPDVFAQAGQPRRGGPLTVMLELDTRSLDPLFGNATTVQRKIYNLYAESLVLQDEKGDFHPWLATSWEVQDGGRSVVFHLRPDIVFHDGTPFDADAAKFNLDRFFVADKKPYPAQYVSEMKSVDKIDARTIKVNLSSPSVLFLPMMANESGSMLSPKALTDLGEKFAVSPVGTGPFKIVTRSGGEIVGERNAQYWRKGADGQALPYLDKVRLVVNADSNVRLLQLESGDALLTDQVSAKDFERVRRNAELQLLDPALGGVFELNYNVTKPPFDNIELRKAISLAIDRQALVKVVTQGNGVVSDSLEPPSSWVFDAAIRGHAYDPEGARKAYAASGHKAPLSLSILQRDPDGQIAEMIQQMCKEAGIDVKIEALEFVAYSQKVLSYNYQFAMARFPLQRPDPHTQYTFSYSRTASTNYSGVKDEQIFVLVDKARQTLDNGERKKLYLEIRQLVNDHYYSSFMFLNPQRAVASKKLRGIRLDGATTWLFDEMWIDAKAK
jgi:peptide/nickel transport system substrate-binding protein